MATVLSEADFRAYFAPIFDDSAVFATSRITAILEDDVSVEVTEGTFGKYYRKAAYYLTAHLLSLFVDTQLSAELAPGSAAMSQALGIMTSATVGDLSKTLEMPMYDRNDDKFLASTRFGQEFIRIRNKMGRGPLIANQVANTQYPVEAIVL